jgi:mxaJ protein
MCSSSRSAAPISLPVRGGRSRARQRLPGWGGTTVLNVGCRASAPPRSRLQARVALPSRGGMARDCSVALIFAAVLTAAAPASARELRVCADPNNLPFSNAAREGFENRIVDLLAQDLGAEISYTWWAQRRGFVRKTLKSGLCDLIPGVAAGMESLRTTAPYYRSTYVFVTREGGPKVSSLDDPVLRDVTIGVQLVGNDGFNTPPAHALSRRGIVQNLRGYSLYGDYSEPSPPARIVKAVADGEVAVAVAWGPLAGYFAKRSDVPLRVTPVQPQVDGPQLPMVFDISMGVRKEDEALRQEIDDALLRRRAEIAAILADYGVPRADAELVQTRLVP